MADAQIGEVITKPSPVEVIEPRDGVVSSLFLTVGLLCIRTFFVWWAVAVWFPQFGLTYWQLLLPVYAVRMLVGDGPRRRRSRRVKDWNVTVWPLRSGQ